MSMTSSSKIAGAAALCLAAICLCIIPVHSSSLWADEAIRVYRILSGSLHETVNQGFCLQQPLYIALEFFWASLFGCSEVALRSLNIPFMLLAIYYMAKILRRLGISAWYSLLLAIHPMAAYYLNDCSPYCMLTAYAAGLFYHLFYAPDPASWKSALTANAFLLLGFATHFLFGFLMVAYAVALALRLREHGMASIRKDLAVFSVCLIPIICLSVEYYAKLPDGELRGWDRPGLSNLSYGLYGLLGFQGLGLSRNELRAAHFDHLTPPMALSLAAYAITLLSLILLNARFLLRCFKKRIFLALGIYVGAFLTISYIKYFQFWDRHLMILLPALIIVQAQLLRRIFSNREGGKKAIACRMLAAALLLGLIGSSCQLRFSPRHGKDDYRGLVACLNAQSDKPQHAITLLQGFKDTWAYYGFPMQDPHEPPASPTPYYGIEYVKDKDLLPLCRQKCREYPTVILVLSERTSSAELFANADAILRQEGFEIRKITSRYTPFKAYELKLP